MPTDAAPDDVLRAGNYLRAVLPGRPAVPLPGGSKTPGARRTPFTRRRRGSVKRADRPAEVDTALGLQDQYREVSHRSTTEVSK